MLALGNCKQIDYGAISLFKQLDIPPLKEEHDDYCEIPPPLHLHSLHLRNL
uniref:DNA transposase THAP9like [Danio rerio] n=1 Tax=Lepeophtheirus salmonis TaxID=72036 RepID=A0A0K2UQ40_LEPSM